MDDIRIQNILQTLKKQISKVIEMSSIDDVKSEENILVYISRIMEKIKLIVYSPLRDF